MTLFKKQGYLEWEDYAKLISSRDSLKYRSETVLKSANNHQARIRRNGGFLIDESKSIEESEMSQENQSEALEEEE